MNLYHTHMKLSKINICIIYSHIDHHLMKYSLVVSTSKIYTTICEAELRLEEKQNINFTYSDDDLRLDDRLEVN